MAAPLTEYTKEQHRSVIQIFVAKGCENDDSSIWR